MKTGDEIRIGDLSEGSLCKAGGLIWNKTCALIKIHVMSAVSNADGVDAEQMKARLPACWSPYAANGQLHAYVEDSNLMVTYVERSALAAPVKLARLGEGEVGDGAVTLGGANLVGQSEHSVGVGGVDQVGHAHLVPEVDALPVVDGLGETGDGIEGGRVARHAVPVAGVTDTEGKHDDNGEGDEGARVHGGEDSLPCAASQEVNQFGIASIEYARLKLSGVFVGARLRLNAPGRTVLVPATGMGAMVFGESFVDEWADDVIYDEPVRIRPTPDSPDKPGEEGNASHQATASETHPQP